MFFDRWQSCFYLVSIHCSVRLKHASETNSITVCVHVCKGRFIIVMNESPKLFMEKTPLINSQTPQTCQHLNKEKSQPSKYMKRDIHLLASNDNVLLAIKIYFLYFEQLCSSIAWQSCISKCANVRWANSLTITPVPCHEASAAEEARCICCRGKHKQGLWQNFSKDCIYIFF